MIFNLSFFQILIIYNPCHYITVVTVSPYNLLFKLSILFYIFSVFYPTLHLLTITKYDIFAIFIVFVITHCALFQLITALLAHFFRINLKPVLRMTFKNRNFETRKTTNMSCKYRQKLKI